MSGQKLDKIDIPVQQTDLSIFDDTFSTLKQKFISEIKRMDDETSKYSSDLLRIYSQSATLLAGPGSSVTPVVNQSHQKGHATRNLQSLSCSPLFELDEDKTMKLQFDVSQFDPTEVMVRLENETLVISASHQEQCDNSSLLRHYHRELKIPKGVDPECICSTISRDGILTVQAPLPHLAVAQSGSRKSMKCANSGTDSCQN